MLRGECAVKIKNKMQYYGTSPLYTDNSNFATKLACLQDMTSSQRSRNLKPIELIDGAFFVENEKKEGEKMLCGAFGFREYSTHPIAFATGKYSFFSNVHNWYVRTPGKSDEQCRAEASLNPSVIERVFGSFKRSETKEVLRFLRAFPEKEEVVKEVLVAIDALIKTVDTPKPGPSVFTMDELMEYKKDVDTRYMDFINDYEKRLDDKWDSIDESDPEVGLEYNKFGRMCPFPWISSFDSKLKTAAVMLAQLRALCTQPALAAFALEFPHIAIAELTKFEAGVWGAKVDLTAMDLENEDHRQTVSDAVEKCVTNALVKVEAILKNPVLIFDTNELADDEGKTYLNTITWKLAFRCFHHLTQAHSETTAEFINALVENATGCFDAYVKETLCECYTSAIPTAMAAAKICTKKALAVKAAAAEAAAKVAVEAAAEATTMEAAAAKAAIAEAAAAEAAAAKTAVESYTKAGVGKAEVVEDENPSPPKRCRTMDSDN
jgi:hypothetical protein